MSVKRFLFRRVTRNMPSVCHSSGGGVGRLHSTTGNGRFDVAEYAGAAFSFLLPGQSLAVSGSKKIPPLIVMRNLVDLGEVPLLCCQKCRRLAAEGALSLHLGAKPSVYERETASACRSLLRRWAALSQRVCRRWRKPAVVQIARRCW